MLFARPDHAGTIRRSTRDRGGGNRDDGIRDRPELQHLSGGTYTASPDESNTSPLRTATPRPLPPTLTSTVPTRTTAHISPSSRIVSLAPSARRTSRKSIRFVSRPRAASVATTRKPYLHRRAAARDRNADVAATVVVLDGSGPSKPRGRAAHHRVVSFGEARAAVVTLSISARSRPAARPWPRRVR